MQRRGAAVGLALALACVAIGSGERRLETTLGELATTASECFGAPVLLEPDLRTRKVRLAPAALELQGEPFTVAFEAALHDAGFVDVEHRLGRAHAHEIVRLADDRDRNRVFETARRLVGRAELESMRERWSYVTTIVLCHGPSSREVQDALLEICNSKIREDARALEGTDALVLTGFAKDLAALEPKLAELGAEIVTLDELAATADAPSPGSVASSMRVVLEGRGGELPLSEITEEVARLLGEPILDASAALAHATIAFDGTIEFDQDSALEWLDLLLARCDFVRMTRHVGALRIDDVVRISGGGWGRGQACRGSARWIAQDEIDSAAGELVSTAIHVRGTNARDYVTALNKHFTGDVVGATRNIEGTDVCVMTGPADGVGFVLRLVRELERHASSR